MEVVYTTSKFNILVQKLVLVVPIKNKNEMLPWAKSSQNRREIGTTEEYKAKR